MRTLVDDAGTVEYRLIELPMVDRFQDEMRDLLQAHWADVRPPWLPDRFASDLPTFRAAEAAGRLFTIAVYAAGDDRLVGFAIGHAYRDTRADAIVCDGFALHIEPEQRTANLIAHLLDVVTAAAAARGAACVQWHAVAGSALDAHLRGLAHPRQSVTVYAIPAS
jgi:GNAT superfamily N-acetyltransferase